MDTIDLSLKPTDMVPPRCALPAVPHGSPAGITPLGCDTEWCHATDRPLLPLGHPIVFGMALALFMDVGTSVMWQLVPFTWHPSDVASTHADRLILLSYSTLYLPGHGKRRSIWITSVNWVGSGVHFGDSVAVWCVHCFEDAASGLWSRSSL